MMSTFDQLNERGFCYQTTDETVIRERLDSTPVTFYIGFDPTADSLHIGSLLPIMAMRLLQKCGHRPIVVLGGGTAMVGDPSGKTDVRKMLTREAIAANGLAIKEQFARYIEFGDDKAIFIDNAEWLLDLKYIEFLRDIGRHFSVNRMLATESVKSRLEVGLSFLEFNYSLLQAYDFYVLARDYDCEFQMGGQDQWGNIVAGVDLVRRLLSRTVYGATFPLLLDSAGNKFGKTVAGAIWLDKKRTSVFDYYQFWRNVDDADVGRLLSFVTDLPMDEVTRLAALMDTNINRAKEILAFEAAALAHGADEAARAFIAAGRQFGFADPDGTISTSSAVANVDIADVDDNLPTCEVARAGVENGLWIVRLLVSAGLEKSNSAARRLVQGGGAYINDEKVTDVDREIVPADFTDGWLLLRSGRKNICRIVLKNG